MEKGPTLVGPFFVAKTRPPSPPRRQPQVVDVGAAARGYFNAGKFDEVVKSLQLAAWNQNASSWLRAMLCAALLKLGRFDETEKALARAGRRDGETADLLALRGLLLKHRGFLADSLEVFRTCRSRFPEHFDGLHNGGVVACDLAQFDVAEEFARAAVALTPGNTDALRGLARILVAQRKAAEAKAVFEQLEKVAGTTADVVAGLAACRLLSHDAEGALPYIEHALERDPNNATTWANKGIALKALGQYRGALTALQEATRLAPRNTENMWNLSLAELAVGDFASGWAHYEVRYSSRRIALDRVKLPNTDIPQLEKGESAAGKLVAIVAEQGLGDFIQFCRLAEKLKAEGARILLVCPDILIPLAQTLPWANFVSNCIPRTGSNIDAYVLVMSLPYRYDLRVEAIPRAVPYLFPTRERLEKWRPRLASSKARVGLVWAGRPTHGNDFHRSTSLQNFVFLRRFSERIEFFSLQMGERSADPALEGVVVHDLSGDIVDFADSAAILAELDLLISIDSAPVHLAGALGRPCWALISKSADFRWLTEQQDTPWYPSIRLFRQPVLGDWGAVFEQVEVALEEFLETPRVAAKLPVLFSTSWGAGEYTPMGPAAQVMRAVEAHKAGDLAGAASVYEWVLRYDPVNQDALRNLGVAYRNLGQREDARRVYELAMQHYPDDATLLTNFCNLAFDQSDMEAVGKAAQRAVELAPETAGAWYMLALAGERLGYPDDGMAAIDRAVALAPARNDFKVLRAVILRKRGEHAEAERLIAEALSADPANADGWLVQAQCHCHNRRFEAAVEAFDRSSALNPDNAAVWINRAVALSETGRIADALRSAERGVELAQDNPEAHFNLSLLYLATGDYERGWKEYHWRMDERRKPRDRRVPPNLRKPMWRGEPLQGKTLLLMPEQGLGDWIQFVRYAALLQKLGARVAAAAHQPLHRLFGAMPFVDRVYMDGETIDYYDYWALPLSLPEYLGTEPSYAVQRYFEIPAGLVSHWAARIGERVGPRVAAKPRIGVVWEGRSTHPRDLARSIAIAKLAPLLLDERYDWVALQHGNKYAQGYQLGPRLIHNLGKQVADFADTAAILANLDLLISIDSAPVHLAGAMGVPCWVMLDAAPDWRWGLQGSSTPWYPSLRLFRQPVVGDWGSVVQQLRVALEQQFSKGDA